jgi:hypothetical protein
MPDSNGSSSSMELSKQPELQQLQHGNGNGSVAGASRGGGSPGRRPDGQHQCGHCGQAGAGQMCSDCKCTWYCSAACRKAHWKVHRPHCSYC